MGDVRQVQFGARPSQSQDAASETGRDVGNVVDLGAFRTRKGLSADRKVSIGEAFSGTSPGSSKVSSVQGKSDVELSERIERIKSSINRINQLMTELRGVSKEEEGK